MPEPDLPPEDRVATPAEQLADVLQQLATVTGERPQALADRLPKEPITSPAQVDAAVAALVRRPLIAYLSIHEDDARRLFDDAIGDRAGVLRLLAGLRQLPGPLADPDAVVRLRWGQGTLAMALLPPAQVPGAPARLARLQQALGSHAVALNAPELHRLLRYLPADGASEALIARLPASLPALLDLAGAAAGVG